MDTGMMLLARRLNEMFLDHIAINDNTIIDSNKDINVNKNDIQKLRERLGLDRHEFARFLGLTSYGSMMNIENGERNPSKLAKKILAYLASLPKAKALAFIEELNRHELE